MINNLAGQRFGRWVALKCSKKRDSNGGIRWLCKCDCGNLVEVRGSSLLSGSTMSCGCLTGELARMRALKHGDAKMRNGKETRLYSIWINMKDRCLNSCSNNYQYYGRKGISVCPEWINDYSVFKEWALTAGYRERLTIDRINNDGNYEPKNCRWITKKENSVKSQQERRAGKAQCRHCLKWFKPHAWQDIRYVRWCDHCRNTWVKEQTETSDWLDRWKSAERRYSGYSKKSIAV